MTEVTGRYKRIRLALSSWLSYQSNKARQGRREEGREEAPGTLKDTPQISKRKVRWDFCMPLFLHGYVTLLWFVCE